MAYNCAVAQEDSNIKIDNISEIPPSTARIPKMFSALRHYNFRLFWFGQMISLVGTWMQNVGQGWLVLQLTNSAFLLGLVSASGALPVLLFSSFGGVLADRFNKRNLIVITQISATICALILALLTLTKQVQYWQIIIIASCLGTVMALDAPTRLCFVIEMVGREDLLNAIALNSSVFNMARIIGPAIAGLIIGSIGVGLCFLFNGVSFLPVILGLLIMKGNFEPIKGARESFVQTYKQGFSYIRKDKRVISFLALVACSSIFIMPYAMLMPIFARDILKVGPRGLGLLLAAAGAGALIGALNLAALGNFKKKGRLVFWGSLIFTAGVFFFSFSANFYICLLLLFFVGWGMIIQNASINSLLQTMVSDQLRGRVMSLYTLTFIGMMPIGSLLAGFLANYFGAQLALRIGAIIVVIVIYIIYKQNKELFKLGESDKNSTHLNKLPAL